MQFLKGENGGKSRFLFQPMKRILKQADIDEIKAYLIGGQFPGNLTKSKKQSFVRKANQYKLIDNELYLANSGTSTMMVVADDDSEKRLRILTELHGTKHNGMSFPDI